MEFLEIYNLSYDEAVIYLLNKYGCAKEDYFTESSYTRLLNTEIKNPTKGKITRTDEGLYCHHIDENRHENISNPTFIEENQIPFEMQKKERLVYCNLVEHAILHAHIANETKWKFGKKGLDFFLIDNIIEWYLVKEVPKLGWQYNCYKSSNIDEIDAELLLGLLGEKIHEYIED